MSEGFKNLIVITWHKKRCTGKGKSVGTEALDKTHREYLEDSNECDIDASLGMEYSPQASLKARALSYKCT